MILKRPEGTAARASLRSLVAETALLPCDLVAPFFVLAGENQKQPISSMPGISRLSVDHILAEAGKTPCKRDSCDRSFSRNCARVQGPAASEALNPDGVIPQAVRRIKKEIPSLSIITDIALDPFTSHGHDGLLSPSGLVLNDDTVECPRTDGAPPCGERRRSRRSKRYDGRQSGRHPPPSRCACLPRHRDPCLHG